MITEANKETGIINANKQIDNKNAGWQKFLLGTAKEASTSQISMFVQGLNKELTEVKLTIYEGAIISEEFQNIQKNSMVQDAVIYNTWFNNLKVEIERRKVLMQ